ncbi:MAG: hypothetical protein R3260_03440, partial [Pseudomonas sp.]|nr:hypothetical protein [Pseudomonas sp.]
MAKSIFDDPSMYEEAPAEGGSIFDDPSMYEGGYTGGSIFDQTVAIQPPEEESGYIANIALGAGERAA